MRISLHKFLFLIMLVSVEVNCHAVEPQSGFDLFVEACRWQGANPAVIRSGYAEFVLLVKTPSKTKKETQNEIDQIVNDSKKTLKEITDERLRKRIEETISLVPEAIQARNSGERKSRVKILFDGNYYSGPKRFEVVNFDPVKKEWGKLQVAIRKDANKQGGNNVLWDAAISQATLTKDNFGTDEFYAFGRLQGPAAKVTTLALQIGLDENAPDRFAFLPSSVTALKNAMQENIDDGAILPYQLSGEVEYEPGSFAYALETKAKTKNGLQLTQRYLVDVSRAYICPLVQYYGEDGNLVLELKSKDYFMHEESGLWFPAYHRRAEYIPGSDRIKELREYLINKETLKLNQEVSEEEFSIQVPPDAKVVDMRQEQSSRYRSTQPVTLSFAEGGLDLKAIPGLQIEKTIKSRGSLDGNGRNLTLIVINVVVIAVLVAIISLKRARSKTLLLLLAFISLPGCNHNDDFASDDDDSMIKVVPDVIDFGRVRESDGLLELSFSIENKSTQLITVSKVISGCSCTAPKMTESELKPLDDMNVPFKVRLRGRRGPFSNDMLVYTSSSDEPTIVHVKGEIFQDIWFDGQSVRCSASVDSQEAEGTFEVYTKDWPNVDFDLNAMEDDISIQEISRVNGAGETAIKFKFSLRAPLDKVETSRHIVLKPTDNRIKPLEIPVICYRPALRQKQLSSLKELRPERISVGVIRPDIEYQFTVFGQEDTIASLEIIKTVGLPKGLEVILNPDKLVDNKRKLTLRENGISPLGFFDGKVSLKSSSGREFSISLIGTIRPNRQAEAVSSNTNSPVDKI